MFEKRLKEISIQLDSKSKKEYCIVTHKKHNREIYFQNNDEAIKFIKIKFDPALKKLKIIKKLVYFLIKKKLLQIFLKKIMLSSELGEAIFVGNQIKSFDLKNKIVFSFPISKENNKEFLQTKRLQKKIAEKDFAPEILELNNSFPFSKEELLKEYEGGKDLEIFKKLHSFYKQRGVEKICLKKYIQFLNKEILRKGINIKSVRETLNELKKSKKNIFLVSCHGNFTKEQILLKEASYVFIDWEPSPYKDPILKDLINFFKEKYQRKEGNIKEKSDNTYLMKKEEFIKIINLFPKEVKENIMIYFVLDKMNSIIRKKIMKK